MANDMGSPEHRRCRYCDGETDCIVPKRADLTVAKDCPLEDGESTMTDLPVAHDAPGSPEARDRGCLCPDTTPIWGRGTGKKYLHARFGKHLCYACDALVGWEHHEATREEIAMIPRCPKCEKFVARACACAVRADCPLHGEKKGEGDDA